MMSSDDFNPTSFEQLIRKELIEQAEYVDDPELKLAFHRVIAYNSIFGEYEDGKYDNKG
jgi:hypothetical protein